MACQKVCNQGRNREGTKEDEVEPSRAMVKCSRQWSSQAGAHWHAKSLFTYLGFHFECLCDQQDSWLPCYNCKTVKKQAGIRLDSTVYTLPCLYLALLGLLNSITLYHGSTQNGQKIIYCGCMLAIVQVVNSDSKN